ncbi:unnamed protein product, partial [Amoebophrya sp. A25]
VGDSSLRCWSKTLVTSFAENSIKVVKEQVQETPRRRVGGKRGVESSISPKSLVLDSVERFSEEQQHPSGVRIPKLPLAALSLRRSREPGGQDDLHPGSALNRNSANRSFPPLRQECAARRPDSGFASEEDEACSSSRFSSDEDEDDGTVLEEEEEEDSNCNF